VRYRRPDRGDLSPERGTRLDRCRESHASPPEPRCARREAKNGAANAGTRTRAAGPANGGGTQRLARRGLVGKPGVSLRLTDALRDRGRRPALEVGDGGRVRVLDAVARVRRAQVLDVLDARVVGELELRQGRAGVAGGMVGV